MTAPGETTAADLARMAETFRSWWESADRVLIGAGAGLSAAAGIDYTDEADFARLFPALTRRGLKARYQLIGYSKLTPAQHWAYWAAHVSNVRFGPRPHPVYGRLHELVAAKDTFVLTSNVDGMFVRNGFDPDRIFTPQGDYAAMQCRTPCRPIVWESQPMIDRVLAHIGPDGFEVTDSDSIPRCPSCGGEVFLNVRLDGGFVGVPYRAQAQRLAHWLKELSQERLLVIEIGAGFNTPAVVRWQMEGLALSSPRTRFVRINRDDPEVPAPLVDRSLSLAGDAGRVVDALWNACDAGRRGLDRGHSGGR